MFEETSGNLGSHDKSVLEKGRWSVGVLLSCGQKKNWFQNKNIQQAGFPDGHPL
jgi:hypothetical protein